MIPIPSRPVFSLENPHERTWWDRNWKWFLPLGCLSGLTLVIGFLAAVLVFVFGLMKSSDAYKLAFAKAQQSPVAMATLGEPLKSGLFVSGNVHVNGSSGAADLAIPVSGPKGSGTLHLQATKSAGRWTFQQLFLDVTATGQRIDLLEETAP